MKAKASHEEVKEMLRRRCPLLHFRGFRRIKIVALISTMAEVKYDTTASWAATSAAIGTMGDADYTAR